MNIKKRIILGAAVGTTVFGSVFGLAAGLTVHNGSLGSGGETVTSCDSVVSTEYLMDADGEVSHVVITGIDAACAGEQAWVRVVDAQDSQLAYGHGSLLGNITGPSNELVVELNASANPAAVRDVIVTIADAAPYQS